MNPIKADELFTAWSRGHFRPVYLFTGQEDFLIEEAVQKLTAREFPSGDADINRDRLDAEKASGGEILQACQTVPFAGLCRLVEVRNVSRLSNEDQKILAAGLARLPATTRLVLIWGKEWRKDDAHKPLIEAVGAAGAVVIFWPLYPEQAQRWLLQRAKHYNKTLSPDSASWLVQEAGVGLRRLDQELLKACDYVGGRGEITREDLEACFGYQAELSPYEWLTAIQQKKVPQSMRTLRQLLEEDEEPLKLLAMATYAMRDKVKNNEGLTEGLSFCVEAHQSIKTGKETPSMALTLLTLRLCGLESLDSVR
jgi:DNA polymerase-3 subunit delta